MDKPKEEKQEEKPLPTTEQTIKEFKEVIEKLTKEKDEYLAGWQRAKADLINYKKDEAKRQEVFVQWAHQAIVVDLISVLDSFEIALAGFKEEDKKTPLYKGFYMIYDQFKQALRKYGLSEIKAVGEKFNPELHEAIEKVKGGKPDFVIEEIQKGYLLNGRVIRPSKVKIITSD